MLIKNFTDLVAWQESHKLVLEIYKITKSFPSEERFSLIDQLRRAAVSITSNIAEGFGRQGVKEKIQFLHLSLGSCFEVENQIIIAKDLGYIGNHDFVLLKESIQSSSRLINGFIRSIKLRQSSPPATIS